MKMLTKMKSGAEERVMELEQNGYKAYTTASGWIGYNHEKMIGECAQVKQLQLS